MMMKKIILYAVLLGFSAFLYSCERKIPEALYVDNFWLEAPSDEPVIKRGSLEEWDYISADNPFIFEDKGIFYCFYEGENKNHVEQIGVAVSKDMRIWEKSPNNPIIKAGAAGEYDSKAAKIPVVFKKNTKYYLLYTAVNDKGAAVAEAVSNDLLNWEKLPDNPVILPDSALNEKILTTNPNVFLQNDRVYTICRGMEEYYVNQQSLLAESDDMRTWKKSDKPLRGLENIFSFAIYKDSAGIYIGIPEDKLPRYYHYSNDLINWRKGKEVLFSSGWVSTLSNPIYYNGDLWALYERYDRIYRACLKNIPPDRIKKDDQKAPFYDDFTDSNKTWSAWDGVNGKWIVFEGRLKQLSNEDVFSRRYVNTEPLKNHYYEMKIKISDGKGIAGIYFFTNKQYYFFGLTGGEKPSAALYQSDGFSLSQKSKIEEKIYDIKQQIIYPVRMEINGNVLMCYLEGKIIFQKIETNLIDPGRFGIFTKGTSCEFDDCRLSDISSE